MTLSILAPAPEAAETFQRLRYFVPAAVCETSRACSSGRPAAPRRPVCLFLPCPKAPDQGDSSHKVRGKQTVSHEGREVCVARHSRGHVGLTIGTQEAVRTWSGGRGAMFTSIACEM